MAVDSKFTKKALGLAAAATVEGSKAAAKAAGSVGRAFMRSSSETKGAAAGSAALGGVGLAFGTHMGIAAAGTAISGAVVVPAVLAVAGVGAGFMAVKAAKRLVRAKDAAEPESPPTAVPTDGQSR
jgi:threonine/homoserine/homoserine lactone efflux protein